MQPTPLDIILFLVLLAWQLFWRAVALWKAAINKQRNWFILFILFTLVNTLGLVELIYLFRFAKHKLTLAEIKSWVSRKPQK